MANIESITVESVYVEAMGMNHVEATINGVSEEDLLERIDAKVAVDYYGSDTLLDLVDKDDAVSYYGAENLLEIIGQEAAIKYFGIEVAE